MTEKKTYTAGEAIAIGLLSPIVFAAMSVLLFPLAVFCAWCDLKVWNWFGAPYFHLQPMSLWVSLGIGLWLRMQNSGPTPKEERYGFWEKILVSAVLHGSSLLFAYLVHRYTK